MLGPLIPVIFALVLLAVLYLRYRSLLRRTREHGTGSTQYLARQEPPKGAEGLALPGSRLGERAGPGKGAGLTNLEVTPEVIKTQKKTARRRGIIRSRADIRKSYIVDALLERPKF